MSRRPYIRPIPRSTWYLHNQRYRSYMLRELTSILVAAYCVLMLIGLAALAADDPVRWNTFIERQQHAGWMVFHTFSLVFFTIYQTMAWFRLAPKALPLQVSRKRVAAPAIVAAHYVAWIIVTVLVLWLAGVF